MKIDALLSNTHGQCHSKITAKEACSNIEPRLPTIHKTANVVRIMAISYVILTAQHTREHVVHHMVSPRC